MPNNTVIAPLAWATNAFSIFGIINWGEIASAIEQKSVAGAVTTAEHVAEAVVDQLAKSGNVIAVEAKAVLPAAESLIGVVLNLTSALHAANALAPPVAAAAPMAQGAQPKAAAAAAKPAAAPPSPK
jgi:hypothetical protein